MPLKVKVKRRTMSLCRERLEKGKNPEGSIVVDCAHTAGYSTSSVVVVSSSR